MRAVSSVEALSTTQICASGSAAWKARSVSGGEIASV